MTMKSGSESIFSNALELSQHEDIEPSDIPSRQSIASKQLPPTPAEPRSSKITSQFTKDSIRSSLSRTPSKAMQSPSSQVVSDETEVNKLCTLISSHFLKNDRILIISSGTKSKSIPIRDEMRLSSLRDIVTHDTSEFQSEAVPARQLYSGKIHKSIVAAVDQVSTNYDVDHMMLSPFYGLMQSYRKIVSYDCTYANKPYYIQVQMAVRANIPFRLQQTILQPEYDVVILAFAKSYQVILDLLSTQALAHKSVYKLQYNSNGFDLIKLGR